MIATYDEIEKASEIVYRVFNHAVFTDPDFYSDSSRVPDYLVLTEFNQNPHERLGQFKSPTIDRYLKVFPAGGVMGAKSSIELCVDNAESDGNCTIEDYLDMFYRGPYEEGWALGISPIIVFKGECIAQCVQVDFEVGPDHYSTVKEMLTSRHQADKDLCFPTEGLFVVSSTEGMHFHSSLYFPRPSGNSCVSHGYGTFLLLNHDELRLVDDRQIGHNLRSLHEEWPENKLPIGPSELGCLRITRSKIKPSMPEIID